METRRAKSLAKKRDHQLPTGFGPGVTSLVLHLTGIKPMLQHNGRLSNPLDPHTRAIKAIANKRGKTDADLAQLAALEARGSMYETADGYIGLPVDNVWRCLWDAAKRFKRGPEIKEGVLTTDEVVPILIDGKPIRCDEFLRPDKPERLHYVSVVVNRNRTMRARPIIPIGWEATVTLGLLPEAIQRENLKPIIARAQVLGLGDWRPKYGAFEAKVS